MRLLVSCDDIVVLVVVDQAVVFLLVFFGGSYEDLADGTPFDSADGVLACEERMVLITSRNVLSTSAVRSPMCSAGPCTSVQVER